MSAVMLGSLIQIQGGQDGAPSGPPPDGPPPGGPPEASEAASKMISDLDTDGDGVVSLEEASASGSDDAAAAFGILDADGDGLLTQGELTSTLEEMGPPPAGPPRGSGGSMTSADIGAQILADVDADQSKEGSMVDTDRNKQLSLAELTVALDRYLTRSAVTSTQGAVTA